MSNAVEGGTDQASIRPVSSLRSLFEIQGGIGTPKSSSHNTPVPPSIARLEPSRGSIPTITRASLDLPRTSSPWPTSDNMHVQQRQGHTAPPVPHPRRSNSKILQRPLSTTSLSGPQSPPSITVDGSIKLGKPPPSVDMHRTLQASISSPVVPVRPIFKSPHTLGPPAHNSDHGSDPKTHKLLTTAKTVNLEDRSLHSMGDDRSAPVTTTPIPPSIKRAEKPKIPFKATSLVSKANLEPLVQPTSERVSPFSTPPSSDGSPEQDIFKNQESSEEKSRDPLARSRAEHATNVSCKSGFTLSDKWSEASFSHADYKRSDPRTSGFTQISAPYPRTETPPSLPPRRDHDQRIASDKTLKDMSHEKMPVAASSPADRPKRAQGISAAKPEFLPPPKRNPTDAIPYALLEQDNNLDRKLGDAAEFAKLRQNSYVNEHDLESSTYPLPATDYPDASNSNRRLPLIKNGVTDLSTNYDSRLVDLCDQYVVATGHTTRVWNVVSGELVAIFGHGEKDVRVTAVAFKAARTTEEEGSQLWLGTSSGDIQEVRISSQGITPTTVGAHERREIIKIHRYQHSMWTIDDGGRLCVWGGSNTGLADLQCDPVHHRIPRGHTFSIVIHNSLWLATGKDIRVLQPNSAGGTSPSLPGQPLCTPNAGPITSGATLGSHLDRVYFGHSDGKVTVYSTIDFTFLGVISISNYRISCLVGAGSYLWAGFNTGSISVYDTTSHPWITRKTWLGHGGPIANIVVDRSSLWKGKGLRVVSLGTDHVLKFWDGTLETDWLENDMRNRDIEYCSFREVTALVFSWNAGAATPTHLRHDEGSSKVFPNVLLAEAPPDLIVFGFQELVDLEDKKLTAKSLLRGSKRKDPSEQEHMSHQYRDWRDFLIRCIEDTMPSHEPYYLLHTMSMVGLFSCVFIKASQRNLIRNLDAIEIKRGMGGLHGNKGALVLRFALDDTSICLINCHLAAGQTQTINRNNDLSAVLEATDLSPSHHASMVSDTYVNGGDGSMVLDHEICILNGDLNYRIDTMGRDTVIKAIGASQLPRLLERDQLLVTRRRNAALRIRAFMEHPITFSPTYKYDVGSDRYDTSEKRRVPAWCDRILYRGAGKIKQTDYRRHELRVSDHRPVTGRFNIRIKTINPERRANIWKDSEIRFQTVKETLAKEAKIQYLRDVLGVPPSEARRLI